MNRTISVALVALGLVFASATTIALGAAASPPAPLPDRQEVIRYAATSAEGFAKKAGTPVASTTSRDAYTCSLALAEAKAHPEWIELLLRLGASMQDRDPKDKGYGNFRWNWGQPAPDDMNAVEFCMQGGTLLWLRHRDELPEAARTILRETMEFAAEGCLRHKVRPSYSNISLMNASNLILLGEALDKPTVADEGYTRLATIVRWTADNGISEYDSPTYYGVDVDDLGIVETFCKRDEGRRQARAMLDLFWTDIALNFFPPSQRLAGPRSRDYDYLRGHGILENQLWINGWISGKIRGSFGILFPAIYRWQPPARLFEMSQTRFPRLVRQAWGNEKNQSRTHYLAEDVTLGCAGANYHNMDLPLTVDLPGDIDMPRCYFIPDARHDPYGKIKIKEGKGPHSKTLHLRPFWTAAQRRADALGLVLYRDEDMTKEATTLESHFVMPRAVDGFWVGDRQVKFEGQTPATFPVKIGEPVVLRKGTAAVGLRVTWSQGVAGKDAPAALVYDGNEFGVVRLTVTHYDGKEATPSVVGAGAALWVRVGSGLRTDAAFDAWRKAFAAAKADGAVASGKVGLKAGGLDGPLAIEVEYPAPKSATVDPPLSRAVLELDGEDIGAKILADLDAVKNRPPAATAPAPAKK